MSQTRVTRLLATGAVSTVLAVGGLSLASSTATAAAQAPAGSTATYSCNFGPKGTHDVPARFSIPGMPAQLASGYPVPEGLPMVGELQLPSGMTASLVGRNGTLQGAVNPLVVSAGPGQFAVPVNGSASAGTGSPADDALPLTGTLDGFTPSGTGAFVVAMPTSFDVGLSDDRGASVGGGTCRQKSPAGPIATSTIVKQQFNVKGTVIGGKVKKNQRPAIRVTVRSEDGNAAGNVVAKLGAKTIGTATLTKGAAVLKLKKLGVGNWKVKLLYLGNDTTDPSEKTVKVRVVR